MSKVRNFLHKHLVTIVMVPSLIGLHLGWDSLQHNKMLVSDYERKELPLVIAIKTFWDRARGAPADDGK